MEAEFTWNQVVSMGGFTMLVLDVVVNRGKETMYLVTSRSKLVEPFWVKESNLAHEVDH